MDWTYDLYIEDLKTYGIEDENSDNYNAYFVAKVKKYVAEFLAKWNEAHDGKLYVRHLGYAGDEFAKDMGEWFSDFYKDTYNQRPHLPTWFYVHPLGLPTSEDTLRTFCASPVEDAVESAKYVREHLD